jgi:hypothetical protein
MAIFAVMGLGDLTALSTNIEREFPGEHYTIDTDKWLISATGQTAREIGFKIGMNPDQKVLGLIVTFGGYHGWASKEIWEWIKAKTSG